MLRVVRCRHRQRSRGQLRVLAQLQTLLQRCGGFPLAVHLAKQLGPLPFLAISCAALGSDPITGGMGIAGAIADAMRQSAIATEISRIRVRPNRVASRRDPSARSSSCGRSCRPRTA